MLSTGFYLSNGGAVFSTFQNPISSFLMERIGREVRNKNWEKICPTLISLTTLILNLIPIPDSNLRKQIFGGPSWT